MIWIPFAGAISEAVGVTLEKKVLNKRKIDYKRYTVLGFLAIVIVMLPFLYFFWNISSEAFLLKNILLLAFIIVASIAANLLIFYSLKREDVTQIEPVRLMQPLFVILLALIFFSSERKLLVIVPAIVASLALVFSHIKKNHFVFNKYLFAALVGSFFFATELVATRALLPFYSSLTFYFVRCSFVLIITFLVFRKGFKGVDNISKILIFITGAIWVAYRLILYYGYVAYGVVFTTLLFILAPVFIYLFARIFLKEKLTWKNIVATIVIVACVAYVIIIGA